MAAFCTALYCCLSLMKGSGIFPPMCKIAKAIGQQSLTSSNKYIDAYIGKTSKSASSLIYKRMGTSGDLVAWWQNHCTAFLHTRIVLDHYAASLYIVSASYRPSWLSVGWEPGQTKMKNVHHNQHVRHTTSVSVPAWDFSFTCESLNLVHTT